MNRCYTYLLPIISETLKIDKTLLSNVYLTENKTTFDPHYVFLTFKNNDDYLSYLKSHPQVKNVIVNENETFVKFELNAIQYPINILYLRGKYSLFPTSYKEKILAYHNLNKTSKQFQILYKAPMLKERLEQTLNVQLNNDTELGVKTNIYEESYE